MAGLSVEYAAEPGSPSAERLHLLASWAATAVAAEFPDETSPGRSGAAPKAQSATPKEPDADHPQFPRYRKGTRRLVHR
jgi:hypothetical protein